MSVQAVARRYATALADVALSRGEAPEVQQELKEWESLIQSHTLLQEVIVNPTVPYDQKQRLIKELIARSEVRSITANFVQLLLKNQRLADLPAINEKFAAILDERAGIVGAEVTSARPVSDSVKASIEQRLQQVTGSKVRVSFNTDEELIGGFVTKIGSTVYDGSIKNQLDELGKRLAG